MSRNILTAASFVIIFLFARSGYSQEAACKVSSLRGAASPAGAEGTMVVVNNGRACEFAVYENPAQRRNPGAEGEVTLSPKNGKVELKPPRVQYTPAPGYSGEDAFAVQMWTGGTKAVLLKFNFKVTVQPPS
jgi:hypothetical protein